VVLAVTAALRADRSVVPTGNERARAPWLPWFLQLFLGLVVLNSLHAIPAALQGALAGTSRACLVLAIAALGLKTALRSLAEAGWRPLLLLLAETVLLAAIVLAFIELMTHA
jgi:uncharacterized membrane protein YadS